MWLLTLKTCSYLVVSNAADVSNKQTNSVAFSLRANYTDWRLPLLGKIFSANFVDTGVMRGQRGGSPTNVNFNFLDRLLFLTDEQTEGS
jgi:hypothetical protein